MEPAAEEFDGSDEGGEDIEGERGIPETTEELNGVSAELLRWGMGLIKTSSCVFIVAVRQNTFLVWVCQNHQRRDQLFISLSGCFLVTASVSSFLIAVSTL